MSNRVFIAFCGRVGVLLVLCGILYGAFVYLPQMQARKEDQELQQQQDVVALLKKTQLQINELSLINPDNPSVYTDLVSYNESLRQTVADLAAQQSYISEHYPQQTGEFAKLTTNAQVVWLEFSAFYDYSDVLFAYNPLEDLPTDGSLSITELQARSAKATEALGRFTNETSGYKVNNQFQLSNGSTVRVDGVTAFRLSKNTKIAINTARNCLKTLNLKSPNRCDNEMVAVKRELLTELRNILSSENAKQLDDTTNKLIEVFGN